MVQSNEIIDFSSEPEIPPVNRGYTDKHNSLARRLTLPFKAIARAYEIADRGLPMEENLTNKEREAERWVRDYIGNPL